MRNLFFYIFALISVASFSQEEDKAAQLKAAKNANDLVFEGNDLLGNDDFVSAEMAYREAISESSTETVGVYNLGTSQILEGNLEEALYQLQKSAKAATSKSEKHQAFHNIGNILMTNKKCKEAVEAYKNALRNNPTDDESRYNLALAQDCAKQQEDQNQDDKKDEDQDKQDENKDQDKDKDKDDQKDKGDQDKKEGDDKEDEDGKPKDDEQDKGKENQDPGKDKEQQPPPPQPQPGQMSPQQMKNLLEAMNNQESKVQEKMNAEKQKGVKVQTEKDW
ncbi:MULTISPECIES: tetratricopeptide repeat protein [Bizionia]|uniref:Tetratricopeptide repeat protein n=1 Tax=Bizionia algoritergicola TaxID=291187 RepID=A0A5D0R159_9FLAO|nr:MULTISPECIES: tetratricopeptide repeat protein [Bizionia]OBX24322.1 aerotolerance regulator BatC [Bizionia sp. APA-3]TYB75242.1 tetratricopeptide repeat protein [Bizionia algoritergicola]